MVVIAASNNTIKNSLDFMVFPFKSVPIQLHMNSLTPETIINGLSGLVKLPDKARADGQTTVQDVRAVTCRGCQNSHLCARLMKRFCAIIPIMVGTIRTTGRNQL